jgi:uncharacterized protein (DUF488 family)
LSFIIYTTGFTKWKAKDFFYFIKENKISSLVDIRRFPNSQLSGYTKSENFSFFLDKLSSCKYIDYWDSLKPDSIDLKEYRNKTISWDVFANRYTKKLEKFNYEGSQIETLLKLNEKENIILLCSEVEFQQCHRNLLTNYLETLKNNLKIININHKNFKL